MKTFQEYIEEKTETKESLFNKLINLSIEKYPKEVEDFLNLISSKDSEIAQIVDKIKYLN
jgi:Mg2+/Co2+ transporter CorC